MLQADDVQEMVQACLNRFKRIDILVNNVGGSEPGNAVTMTEAAFDRQIAFNLKTAFLGCKYVIPVMEGQGKGAIVNISSVAGIVGFSNLAAYAASKGGVRLLTKAAALDVAAEGIRINSVHPGHLDTDMIAFARDVAPEMVTAMEANVPMNFLGKAIDIAAMNLFLASDESQYVTGAEFVVDGGLTAK